jgi:GTPase
MPFPQRSAGNAVIVKGKLTSQDLLNSVNTLIGTLEHRLKVNLGGSRRLVGAIDAGKILQFSASCFGVESFRIATFTFPQRRVNEDLQKLRGFEERTGAIALGSVWADEGDNHD